MATVERVGIGSPRRRSDRQLKYTLRRSGFIALAYVLLLLLSLMILLPLGWMITVALKPDAVPVFTLPPQWFPTKYWEWENPK